MIAEHLILIPGYYRCHNCGRTVDQVIKVRRFRLCPECYEAIVTPTSPGKSGGLTKAEYEARANFWQWYSEMERRYPLKRNWQARPNHLMIADLDSFWPWCECGQPRKEYNLSAVRTLFGGIRAKYCPVCESRRTVESVVKVADKIHPDWDDEDWLDFLARSHPEAFELGVLPAYWFELRQAANG